jgi:hypothetical protein
MKFILYFQLIQNILRITDDSKFFIIFNLKQNFNAIRDHLQLNEKIDCFHRNISRLNRILLFVLISYYSFLIPYCIRLISNG